MRLASLDSLGPLEASPALEAQEARFSAEEAARRLLASAPEGTGGSPGGAARHQTNLGDQTKDEKAAVAEGEPAATPARAGGGDLVGPQAGAAVILEFKQSSKPPSLDIKTGEAGAGSLGAKIFALAQERELRKRALEAYRADPYGTRAGASLHRLA